MNRQLILVSASRRRHKILTDLGVDFDVEIPDVEEVCFDDDPRQTVCENAGRKAAWGRARRPGMCLLAADTVIDFGGQVVSKPESLDEARKMLQAFSGTIHDVLTGVALYAPAGATRIHVEKSTVQFRSFSEETIERYFASVDPLDKAGGYDIDQHPEAIISSFSGSRTNIMGLPAGIVRQWLVEQRIGMRR